MSDWTYPGRSNRISLGDVLGTLEGHVLGTSWGPIFAGWVVLWTYEDKKFNTSNVVLSMSSRTLQLLIPTLNVNKNYQIKWYGQGRRRRLLWISFQLVVSLKLFIHMTFAKSLWKSGLAELFRITCSCERLLFVIIDYENFLSLNLHVIRMSLSMIFFSYM